MRRFLFVSVLCLSLQGARLVPVSFEPSVGPAAYLARGNGYTLFLDRQGALARIVRQGQSSDLRMEFVAARMPAPRAGQRQPGVTNYLLGKDRSAWRTGVPHYAEIRYAGLYPGIDAVFYGSGADLEFDYQVAPGADPSRLRMRFSGARRLRVNRAGDLVFSLAGGDFVQRKPTAYQDSPAGRTTVSAGYRIQNGTEVSLVLGNYDRSRPLVVDPVLSYGALVGGQVEEFALGLAADNSGSAYITGPTTSSLFTGTGFPGLKGSSDCFVTKLNPPGTAVLFTTFLGGSGDETCGSIAVDDADGSILVGGATTSLDLPATAGVFLSKPAGGIDGFVARLNSNGASLRFLTYIGGSNEDRVAGVAVLTGGNCYVAGGTRSGGWLDRLAIPPQSSTFSGGSDGFVLRLNSAGAALNGVYLGGPGEDTVTALTESLGDAVVVGDTRSTQLQGIQRSPAAFQSSPGGNQDAFASRISFGASTTRIRSTYIGGQGSENARAVATDLTGRIYVGGAAEAFSFYGLNGNTSYRTGAGTEGYVLTFDPELTLWADTPMLVSGQGDEEVNGLAVQHSDGDSSPVLYASGYSTGDFRFEPAGFLSTQPPTGQPAGINGFLYRRIASTVTPRNIFSPNWKLAPGFVTVFTGLGTPDPVLVHRHATGTRSDIYVAGHASPTFGFPSSGQTALARYNGGLADAFVAKLANAELRVSATFPGGVALVAPGTNLSPTVTVTNAGPDDADNVRVQIDVDPGLTVLKCVPPLGVCTISPSSAFVTLSKLAAGQSVQLALTLRGSTVAGTPVLRITAASATTNTAGSANLFTAPIVVQTQGFGPAFALSPSTLNLQQTTTEQVWRGTLRVTPAPGVSNLRLDLSISSKDGSLSADQLKKFTATPNLVLNTAAVDIPVEYRPDQTGLVQAILSVKDIQSELSVDVVADVASIAQLIQPPVIRGVGDAASFRPTVAANAFVSIFGSDLMTGTARFWDGRDFQGDLLPTKLAGIDLQVFINGKAAPIAYASPDQINILAPRDPSLGSVKVQVKAGGVSSNEFPVTKQAVAPGFFVQTGNYVAARSPAANVVITSTRGARPSEVIELYMNGLGETAPAYPDSRVPTAGQLYRLADTSMTVRLGTTNLTPLFAGLVGAGLYQVNIQIPAGLATGDYDITATVGGVSSATAKLRVGP